MTLRGVLPNLAEAKRHDSEAAPATEPCGSVLSPADAGQCSRASSLARDLSLDRATSRSLIRNSTIGRSSTTVRLGPSPWIRFSVPTAVKIATAEAKPGSGFCWDSRSFLGWCAILLHAENQIREMTIASSINIKPNWLFGASSPSLRGKNGAQHPKRKNPAFPRVSPTLTTSKNQCDTKFTSAATRALNRRISPEIVRRTQVVVLQS